MSYCEDFWSTKTNYSVWKIFSIVSTGGSGVRTKSRLQACSEEGVETIVGKNINQSSVTLWTLIDSEEKNTDYIESRESKNAHGEQMTVPCFDREATVSQNGFRLFIDILEQKTVEN